MGFSIASLSGLLEKRKLRLLLVLIISLLYLLRIIYLDSDVPDWGVITYMPIDEGIYGELALNMQTFGSLDPNAYYNGQYDFYVSPQAITNIFGNVLIYIFLLLFGDNYFGFRMAPVLLGLACIWIMYGTSVNVLKRVSQSPSRPYALGFLIAFLLLVSFPYFNATRIVDPTIFRLFIVSLLLFVFTNEKLSLPVQSALVGFITIFGIFFVYITNVFLGIPILGYFVFLLVTRRGKRAAEYLLWGLVGALCAYLLACAYYAIWDSTPMDNLLSTVFSFSGASNAGYGTAYQVSLGVTSLMNLRDFFVTNLVLYSPSLVIPFVILFPLLFKRYRNADAWDALVFTLLMIVGLLLQTVFTSDFIVKKQLTILPAFALVFSIEIELLFSEVMLARKRKAIVVIVTLILSILWMAYVAYFRLYEVDTTIMTTLDFSKADKLLLIGFSLLSALSGVIFAVAFLLRNKKCLSICMFAFCLIFVIQNGAFVCIHNYFDQTFTEKETMIKIGKEVDGGVVAGSYYPVFSLYNNTKYLLNSQPELARQMRSNPDSLYYFDYSGMPDATNDPRDLWQNIGTIKTYPRSYRTYGVGRSVSLYKSIYSQEISNHE